MHQERFNPIANFFVGEPLRIKRERDNKRGVGLPIYQVKPHVICGQNV